MGSVCSDRINDAKNSKFPIKIINNEASSKITNDSKASSKITDDSKASSKTTDNSEASSKTTNTMIRGESKMDEVFYYIKTSNPETKVIYTLELKQFDFTAKSLLIIDGANLICPICSLLFSKPTQSTSCGHIFCCDCISKAAEQKKSLDCPICRKLIKETVNDKNIERMIVGLTVYCKYKSNGCLWANTIGGDGCDYLRHITSCSYRIKSCERGCNAIGECKYDDCLMATVQCNHPECPDPILRKDLKEHLTNCGYRLVDCEFKYLLPNLISNLPLAPAKNAKFVEDSKNRKDVKDAKNPKITEDSKDTKITEDKKNDEQDYKSLALTCGAKIQYRHYQQHLTEYRTEHLRLLKLTCDELIKSRDEYKEKFQKEAAARENLDIQVGRLLAEREKYEKKSARNYQWIVNPYSEFLIKSKNISSGNFWILDYKWEISINLRDEKFWLEIHCLSGRNVTVKYTLVIVNTSTLIETFRETHSDNFRGRAWCHNITNHIDGAINKNTNTICVDFAIHSIQSF